MNGKTAITASRIALLNGFLKHVDPPFAIAKFQAQVNRLYYGDSLHVLREHIADESVDFHLFDVDKFPAHTSPH
jgi:hypothetical protein